MDLFDNVILVTGGREYSDYDKIYNALKKYTGKNLLIHGGCRGADLLSDAAAKKLNFSIETKQAEWKKYGKYAGIKRNIEMVDKLCLYRDNGINCVILAFHSDINSSKGTKHCIGYAKEKFNIIMYT